MRRSVTILGCGSSGGVPRVGQGWGDCDPDEPRNRRRRCSILIEQEDGTGKTVVLVDTSPDLREQLIDAGVTRLDGIVYTHDHADHTHGIDDIRPLMIASKRRVEAFMDEPTSAGLATRFGYIFRTPDGSQYPPILAERRIERGEPFTAWRWRCDGDPAIPAVHGDIDALGLRVGGMAYTPTSTRFHLRRLTI